MPYQLGLNIIYTFMSYRFGPNRVLVKIELRLSRKCDRSNKIYIWDLLFLLEYHELNSRYHCWSITSKPFCDHKILHKERELVKHAWAILRTWKWKYLRGQHLNQLREATKQLAWHHADGAPITARIYIRPCTFISGNQIPIPSHRYYLFPFPSSTWYQSLCVVFTCFYILLS